MNPFEFKVHVDTHNSDVTDISKFLGKEKYQPIMNAIYDELGVPPALTGSLSTGGSSANSYFSLKTQR